MSYRQAPGIQRDHDVSLRECVRKGCLDLDTWPGCMWRVLLQTLGTLAAQLAPFDDSSDAER
jgi:hypothetical protein